MLNNVFNQHTMYYIGICPIIHRTWKSESANIVQHLVSLLCTSLCKLNVQQFVPLHSRAVSYHSAGVHDCHNNLV